MSQIEFSFFYLFIYFNNFIIHSLYFSFCVRAKRSHCRPDCRISREGVRMVPFSIASYNVVTTCLFFAASLTKNAASSLAAAIAVFVLGISPSPGLSFTNSIFSGWNWFP